MQIYVCVKHVPDTAAKITVVGGTGFAETCKFIVNPYDEYGVEEAVAQVKKAGSGEVIVVTVGKESALVTIRAALAQGADRGILVKTESHFLDSALTSRVLQKAIEQDGSPDLILCGKQSIDSEGMQTAFRLAKAFDMPVISDVVDLSINDGTATVEREIGGGSREVVEMTLPGVIGATRGLNEPRYPKLPDILKARNKPIAVFELSGLEMEMPASRVEMIGMDTLQEERQPDTIEGTADEIADAMVQVLRDTAKVLDG